MAKLTAPLTVQVSTHRKLQQIRRVRHFGTLINTVAVLAEQELARIARERTGNSLPATFGSMDGSTVHTLPAHGQVVISHE